MRKLLCISLVLVLAAIWVGCGDSSHSLAPTSNVLFVRQLGSPGVANLARGHEMRRLQSRLVVPPAPLGARPLVLAAGDQTVVMMKNDGSNQKVLTSQGETGTFEAVQLSLDGKMAVGSALDDQGYLQIFVVNMANLNNLQPTQLTSDPEHHYVPQLSPDKKTVIFVKENTTTYMPQAFTIKVSGGAETAISTPSGTSVNFPSYTPDGNKIVFEEEENDTISIMNLDGTGIKNLTDGTYFDEFPSVTADGKTIVFSRYGKDTEMAGEEIFSMNIDGSGLKQLTSSGAQKDSWDPIVVNDKILYIFGYGNVYGMNLDGTNQKNLTNSSNVEFFIGGE